MLVGIGVIALCGLYYYVWMKLLPRLGNYSIRSEVIDVDDNGANTHRILRIPNSEVAEWDDTHDELGQKLRQRRGTHGDTTDTANITQLNYPNGPGEYKTSHD